MTIEQIVWATTGAFVLVMFTYHKACIDELR